MDINDKLQQEGEEIERQKLEDEILRNYEASDKMIASKDLKKELDARPRNKLRLNTQFPILNSFFDGFR